MNPVVAIAQWRFSKFAFVGGLGTLVNMACLWAVVQWLFNGNAKGFNLTLAQLMAIAVATVHNFAWNRWWTWRDREPSKRGWSGDFLRYASVAGLSIGLQLLCVALLRGYVHYLFAAAIGIALASVAAFYLNDNWSFKPNNDVAARPCSLDDVLRTAGAATLAVCAYLYAIDSSLIPKNGDENVYLHITRTTGVSDGQKPIPGILTASGWLPLKSELNNMRNTKPPLLFMQARVATEISGKWDIAVLRMPSLLYTLATAGLVVLAGRMLGMGFGVGLLAAFVWLAFFSTFRFGRPFLTTAPEVFWLFAAFLLALRWPIGVGWRFVQHLPWVVGVGLLTGVGLLHKSFALAVPASAGLGLVWTLRQLAAASAAASVAQPIGLVDVRQALSRGSLLFFLVAAVALVVFSLWFAFDPDPRAVWAEFVVGENPGKLGAERRSWISGFLTGSESVWVYLAAVAMNPGPLLLAGLGAIGFGLVYAWRNLRGVQAMLAWIQQHTAIAVLVAWVLVWALVFALPSQRSARYVLPAMPAFALLLAMAWPKLPAWLLRANFVLLGALFVAAAFLAGLVASQADPWGGVGWINLLLCALGLALVAHGLWRPTAWALGLPAACFALYLAFATAFRPLDMLKFSPNADKHLAGQTVAVPCNFRAKFEEYRFLLPRAQITGVHERVNAKAQQLASIYPAFVVRTSPGAQQPHCKNCEPMGSRLVLRSRHSSDEIKAMLKGQWAEHLLAREWLIRLKPGTDSSKPEPDLAVQQALQNPEVRCL